MGSRSAVKQRKPEARPVETGACRHHWIIETPRGALSSGRCERCGEERQFRNSVDDYIWNDWNDYIWAVGLSIRRRDA